ncbi:DUF4012 domain-containing protein [Candidatus Falkowbacteria bacterium]|nr:DUF4012 domain-containing protein [Candidatus Falkowbacteria bacterium]
MRLRTVMAFALVLIVLSLPLRGILMYTSAAEVESKVLNAVRQGVSNLVVAGKATAGKDMGTASQSFTEARSNFLKAREEVGTINQLLLKLASVSPNDKLRLAGNSEAILKAAEASAALGEDLTTVAGILEFKNGSSTDVGAALTEGSAVAKRAAGQARVLSQSLNQINEDLLPDEYARTFTNLRDKTAFLEGSLSDLSVLADSLSLFLGVKQDKRYLLIFQNNAEARATGGFFGSYALIDFSKGKIKNIETPGGGSYDTDAGLRDRIVAPKPLQLISPLWHFWDSNWWPDWQVSAKKMAWFYEKSGGPTVDGVLSFTPAVMEKLLAITGPIDMTQKYGVVITSENFWLETQKLAEQKQDVTKEPKKIIGDLSQKLVEELPKRLNRETTIKLIGMLENSIEEKQILVYFNNDELTSVVKRFGWGGEVKSTNWDYLSVINTNIGGGKSDRSINQIVNHKAILQPDGSIIDELQITRVHNGSPGEVFSGVRNVDWMRIYVPAGSQLLEARGFSDPGKSYFKPLDPSWQKDPMLENEDKAVADPNSGTVVYQDLGKTVFGNWSMIDPGESATMYIRYRLPFRIVKKAEPTTFLEKAEKFLGLVPDSYYPYALLTQKQPGSTATDFTSSFSILPSDKNRGKFDVAWHYPENLNTSGTGWAEQKALNTDQYRAVFLKE